MARRVNYLNNKDLLKEIHKSKVSFCSFEIEDGDKYDWIVSDISEINADLIEEVKASKALKLTKLKKEEMKEQGAKPTELRAFSISPETIKTEELIFKVMTYDHIPEDTERTRKAKTEADKHVRLNFPPFKHFKFNNEGDLIEIGRSHWQGSLANGHFCQSHGSINNKLADMFMKLVEKYSQKGNWRGYCIDEGTEALVKRGWVRMNEITDEDEVLSFNGEELIWSEIKTIYKYKFDGLMFELLGDGFNSLVTPGHKFLTKRGLVQVEDLLDSDEIILMGKEGNYKKDIPNIKTTPEGVTDLFAKIDSAQMFSTLSGQRTALYYPNQIPAISYYPESLNTIHVSKIKIGDNKRNNKGKREPTKSYKGKVWCLQTDYGCFVVRRKGSVYITGNSYNDEMRSQALLQLSMVGLRFDESRSQNPFAYFSSVLTNSFTRVFNVEKKNQNLRDELLMENGQLPSFSKQLDEEAKLREEMKKS